MKNKMKFSVSCLFANFNRHFTNTKFELSHIKDLKSHTYDDLCILLNNFNKKVKINDSIKIVTWESARSILVIKYNSEGIFIEKVLEKWK